MFVVIFLLAVFFCLLIFHVITRYGRTGRLINKIPGPRPLPILGNMLMLNAPSDVVFNVLRELARYPIVRVWFFRNAIVGMRRPDDLEVLLSSQRAIQKSYVYGFLEPWLKTGLLTSTGEKWRSRRKILTPAFHFQILKKYLDITNEQTERFVNKVREEGTETIQSLLPFCSSITLNVICESAMGVALDKLDKRAVKEYINAIQDIGDIAVQRTVKPYLLDWMMNPMLEMGRVQKRALKVLHDFTDKVLKERRNYHQQTDNRYLKEFGTEESERKNDDDHSEKKKRLAMLDLLLLVEQKGFIDEEGIKEEVDTFTFEGHDTTGMALVLMLMLLAENKEAQDRVRSEVRRVLNENGGKLSGANLQELNYTERCVKESLRLFPSVPMVLRHLNEDLKLKDYVLPAGTDVLCFIYDLHRDPQYWPEPNKFDPDRFLPENCVDRHPFAYLPFSAGPRNCIGQKFAINELKLAVSHILLNFHLEPVDRTCDVKFTTDLVLRPAHPVHIKLIRIDH